MRHRLGGYIAIGPAYLVHFVETTSSNNITIYNMSMERDFILDKTGLYCCWSSTHLPHFVETTSNGWNRHCP